MEFHRFTDATVIRGKRSPCLHERQCLESWNPEKVEKKRNNTLQCGCCEHRKMFRMFHSVNQLSIYLQSILKLEWTARSKSERDRANLGKVHSKRRLREQRDSKESEFTESDTLCMCSKDRTGIWKQIAHPSMPRVYIASGRPNIQSIWNDSRKNSDWTSHGSSCRTICWHLRD